MPRTHNRTGRSKGWRYVLIDHWIIDSHAWGRLKPMDRAVWLQLARRYDGANNGRIAASVRVLADEINVSHHSVARALKNLVTFGFIDRTRASSFSRKDRKASEFRLTHLPCDVSGKAATKEFMTLAKAALAKSQSHLSPSQSHP